MLVLQNSVLNAGIFYFHLTVIIILNPVLFSALSVQLFIAVSASSLYSPLITMVMIFSGLACCVVF